MSGRSARGWRGSSRIASLTSLPRIGWVRFAVGWLTAAIVALAALILFDLADTALLSSAHWSGWGLLLIFILQSLQGIRRLKAHRSASLFLLLHLHLGWIIALVFAVHAGGFPEGGFHRVQWITFVLLMGSGAIGFCCERLGSLRQREWDALPYPRITQQRGVLAAESDAAFRNIVTGGCPPLLAHLYAQRVVPFLAGPAHLWAHWTGSRRPLEDLLIELDYASSTVREDESFLRLRQIVIEKDQLDQRWALHWLQRGWLFVHVPAAAVCAVLVLFHILFIHAFGG